MNAKTSKKSLNQRIKDVIKEQLPVEDNVLVPEARFVEDLGIDSLGTVELVMALENEFDIKIPNAEAETLLTLGEVETYIDTALKSGKKPKDTIEKDESIQIKAGLWGMMGSLIPNIVAKSIVALYFRIFHKAEFKGVENFKNSKKGKPTVIVANHVSFYDAPFLAGLLPVKPVFAINRHTYERLMRDKWYFRFFSKKVDLYPIDFSRPHSMKGLIEKAKAGTPVMIFPEGLLSSTTGQIDQVFEGAAMIADQADAEIVPINLDGFHFLKRGVSNDLKQSNPDKIRKTFAPLRGYVGAPKKLNIAEGLTSRERRKEGLKQLEKIMHEIPVKLGRTNRSLIEGVHEAAERYGRKHIILDGPEKIEVTYGELMDKSYAIGGEIKKVTDDGENVGLLLANSIAQSVTFLGMQAYGRVPAMLNPKGGAENLLSCSKAANLKTIVTSRTFVEQAGIQEDIDALAKEHKIVYLEDFKDKLEKASLIEKLSIRLKSTGRVKPKRPNADAPAVILFTSGTSGPPKGVALSHKNLFTNNYQVLSVAPFSAKHKVFNALPGFHSFGLNGGFVLPVLNGMRSYQYPSPLDFNTIPKVVHGFKSTIMFATDTFLRYYAKNATPRDLARLEMVYAGAEPLTDEVYNLYAEKFGVVPMQGYGMTEASPVISVNVRGAHQKGTVGKVVPGMETKLVEIEGMDNGKELHVKGDNVMLGYMKTDNPGVIQAPENGWLNTGDIVTVNNDGYMKITGRSKRLVNFGGEQVQLEVLESFAKAAGKNLHGPSAAKDFEYAVVKFNDKSGAEATALYTTDPRIAKQDMAKAAKETGKSPLGIPAVIHRFETEAGIPKLPTGKPDLYGMSQDATKRAQDKADPAPQ